MRRHRVPQSVLASLAASAALTLGACGFNDQPPVKPPPPPMLPAASAQVASADAPKPHKPAAPAKTRAQKQMDAVVVAAGGMSARDAQQAASAYATNAVVTIYGAGHGGPRELAGREAIAGDAQYYFDAFGATAFGVSRVWEKGSTWAVEWAFNGTQKDAIMGIPMKKPAPPDAAPLAGVVGLSIVSFDDKGLISKEHRYFDEMTIHDQLLRRTPVRSPPAVATGTPEAHTSTGTDAERTAIDATNAFYAAKDGHKADVYLPLIADAAVFEEYATPAALAGATSIKTFLGDLAKTFPDAHTQPLLFAAGGFVVSEWTMTATHAPTSKKVMLHGVDILEWKDGVIATAATYTNQRELLDTLGKLPKP